MSTEFSYVQKVGAAKAAHEVNRAYCRALGDMSQLPWEEAPPWQRDGCCAGVEGVIRGNSPEQSHESWLADKRATGWTYGEVKDAEALTHPCMVPYDQLPPAQRLKDTLFVTTVRGYLGIDVSEDPDVRLAEATRRVTRAWQHTLAMAPSDPTLGQGPDRHVAGLLFAAIMAETQRLAAQYDARWA